MKAKKLVRPLTFLHVTKVEMLQTPKRLKIQHPLTEKARTTVEKGRETVREILGGNTGKFLVIAGPCSIHDERAALEYAHRLSVLQKEVAPYIQLVMRVYGEKPRTVVGWKGLINDPHMNGTYGINEGLDLFRRLLLEINGKHGLPVATEFLSQIFPPYFADLVTWGCIGARNVESQTSREMASGLSMPVGFKNTVEGAISPAVNAVMFARHPHSFPGINENARVAVINTSGNPGGHVVLRGGNGKPNYAEVHLAETRELLRAAGLPETFLVDASHSNSGKVHHRQKTVWGHVTRSFLSGGSGIVGVMLESNLRAGSQKIPAHLTGEFRKDQLEYGVSVTDGCIDIGTTEALVRGLYRKMKARAEKK